MSAPVLTLMISSLPADGAGAPVGRSGGGFGRQTRFPRVALTMTSSAVIATSLCPMRFH